MKRINYMDKMLFICPAQDGTGAAVMGFGKREKERETERERERGTTNG